MDRDKHTVYSKSAAVSTLKAFNANTDK